MFVEKLSILFLSTIFVFCSSAFVDKLEKCGVRDGECQKNLLQKSLREISKTGIPELGIPPIDPYDIKNVSVSVLNMVDITMVDGVARGVKNCVINKFETHVEKDHASMELTCDLTIKGQYKVSAHSPLLEGILGSNSVHGEGFGKVVIQKLHIKFDYHVLVRSINGDTYFDCQVEDLKYQYELGKVTFAADNLYIGERESSKLVVSILNDNWKFIMDSFGKPFMDKAMEIIYAHTHRFFDLVPAKYFITDDLTPFVKNNV